MDPPNESATVEAGADSNNSNAKEKAGWCSYCCAWTDFDGNPKAQGYSVGGLGRGPVYMCTVLLSSAFIFLASREAGCTELDEDGHEVIVSDCPNRVYGVFKPASLITNIATISSLLVAFLLPVGGAVLDYTPYRRHIGMAGALLLVLLEAVQIGTTQSTWFAMAILEAIGGVVFEFQLLAQMAYLPEIAREVGEQQMGTDNALFLMVEVGFGQMVYLMVTVGIALAVGANDVATAQIGQGTAVLLCGYGFYYGWKQLPNAPPGRRQHPEGQEETTPTLCFLLKQGFVQNWRTFAHIHRGYKHSLRWYLLATMLGEGAANAFITVAVIVLTEHLGLEASEIGIVFVGGLFGITLACRPASYITRRTNPSVSWRLAMLATGTVSTIGALTLDRDNARPWAYVWVFFACLALGWHYQAHYTFFTLTVPQGQEAEMSGFWNYCRIILVWLPPLVFSLLVEADVSQSIGIVVVSGFFFLAVAVQSLAAPWDEILLEVHKQPHPTQMQVQQQPGKETASDDLLQEEGMVPDSNNELSEKVEVDPTMEGLEKTA